MDFLTGEAIAGRINYIVHADTQVHDYCVDLTVKHIFRPTHPGRLDFGGSEYQAARRQRLEPSKEKDDDKYGWWILEQGIYQVEFNESLSTLDGVVALIQPHEHLTSATATLPTLKWSSPEQAISLPLHIGENGCHIKENARIAQMLIYKINN